MSAILRRCAFASLGLAAMTVPAQAIDIMYPWPAFQCIAGSCTDGNGTVRIPDRTEYTALWTRGQLTGGTTFRVRSPLDPGRVETFAVNSEGTELRGTELRGNTIGGAEGEFSGIFAEVANPFIEGKTYAYRTGRYTDRTSGYIYDGTFSFIPARNGSLSGGYYVFQGARIDETNNEVLAGLFVTGFDHSSTHYPLKFTRARPDYLVKLKQEFAKSLALLADEKRMTAEANRLREAEAAESARQSSESMASVLGVIGGVIALGTQRGNNSLFTLQDSSFSTLTNGLLGQQSSGDVLNDVLSQVIRQAGNDPALARVLGDTSDMAKLIETLGSLGKSSQPTTVTQYLQQGPISMRKPTPATTAQNSRKAKTPAGKTTPPASAPAAATSARTASADWDALGALGGPSSPDTVPFTVQCGGRSQSGMIPVPDRTNCVEQFKAFSAVRCFPGWPMHKTNIDRLRCAVERSRGKYKTDYSRQLQGAQKLIRENAPECNPQVGCTGRTRLGNN